MLKRGGLEFGEAHPVVWKQGADMENIVAIAKISWACSSQGAI
jgi:hypothetical protein